MSLITESHRADAENQSPTLMVLGALDDRYRPAREIFSRINCWSPQTIRVELYRLAANGLIEQKFETNKRGDPIAYFRHLPE